MYTGTSLNIARPSATNTAIPNNMRKLRIRKFHENRSSRAGGARLTKVTAAWLLWAGRPEKAGVIWASLPMPLELLCPPCGRMRPGRGHDDIAGVHAAVEQVLPHRVAGFAHRDGLAAGGGLQLGVYARPECRQVQFLEPRHHLVAHCGIEVHAVAIDQRLDGVVIAFRLDAHD